MKVLLVSANTETINMQVLPLGMAFVARAVEDAGHEVLQIDLMAEAEAEKTLADHIRAFSPDVIGISVRNIDDQNSASPRFLLEPVKPLIAACRKHSNAKIVLGGAGYSIFPEQTLAWLGADMGIEGEGEQAFVSLLDCLQHEKDPAGIPGLHDPARGIANSPAPVRAIDQLSFPVAGKHIHAPRSESTIWLPFQTRRGCPMACSYCSTPQIEGRITRKRTPEAVVAALKTYVAEGFDHYFFVDNTFNLPPGYALRLCEAIIAVGLRFSWRCILYPWKIDEDLAAKMAAAGCVEASLGFESGSDAMLKRMHKRFGAEDVRRVSDLLRQHQIRQMGFLLLGGPGETRQTVLESLEFVDSLALDMVRVTIGIRIYPHTRLAEYARQTGYIAPDDDLLRPRFYIKAQMEAWLRQTLGEWMEKRPNWIG